MIFNIKDRLEYIHEVARLTQLEWGTHKDEKELEHKINKKIDKWNSLFDENNFCILVLIEEKNLAGFIALLPTDGEEYKNLTPWYGMMYVRSDYRGLGYSRKLNEAILKEAKNRGFNKVYLKSDLINYYEKFDARYMDKLMNGENLYSIEL